MRAGLRKTSERTPSHTKSKLEGPPQHDAAAQTRMCRPTSELVMPALSVRCTATKSEVYQATIKPLPNYRVY